MIAKNAYRTCSVVMAVYNADKSEWFREAIESILGQTVRSDDIVIVRDGPVSDDLEMTLCHYENNHKEIRVLRLDENHGAGPARNAGVELCKNELVAVMDADDISVSNRFELQLEQFKRVPDLVMGGGQIVEFSGTPDNVIAKRIVPCNYNEIRKFARHRSPINNVTTMYKKDIFLSVGGYAPFNRGEDYYAVCLLISKNHVISSIPEILVTCRVDKTDMKVRKSWRQFAEITNIRWRIRKLGVSTYIDFAYVTLAQTLLFIMPVGMTDLIYKRVLRDE